MPLEAGSAPRQAGDDDRLADRAASLRKVAVGAALSADPLEGKRVLVTRALRQVSLLAVELERLGASVVCIPAIEIAPPDSFAPLDDALRRSADFDWIVFSSVNGVRAFGERMRLLGIQPWVAQTGASARARFAAVGPTTAAAIRDLGFDVAVTPEKYVGEALVAALGSDVAGRRVLLVRAKVARDVVPEMLRHAGAAVQEVEAYRNVIPPESVEALRGLFASRIARPHAVTFTSSSTARNFFALLAEAGVRLPRGVALASIGPVTSATLMELGHSPDCEAEQATVGGLAAALATHFARSRGGR